MLQNPCPFRGQALGLLVLLALSPLAAAQVRHAGQPAAADPGRPLPVIEIPAPDTTALAAEDAYNESAGIGPLRYGVFVAAPFELEKVALWDVSADGQQLVGRVVVTAPGARSLGLEFAAWQLGADDRLFVYDQGRTQVFGAYTRENRHPNGEFVIEPFPGDTLVVELTQPLGARERPRVTLAGVIWDYRDVFQLEQGDGGQEGSCTHVNVNCPEGDPFGQQKRATVRTLAGGALCSGVIINNTANNETPYLYTANHCGTGGNVIARFNYQTANCGGGSAPTGQSVSGGTLLVTDQDTDGRLLRLNGSIPDSYMPYYAGWSRQTTNSSFTFAMSMHHPGGSPKKLSIDNNGAFKTTGNFAGIGSVKVWQVTFNLGHTEGGSSGGPLFDQNNRIRATLTGGPSSPCTVSLYGRFYDFWDETNLSNWLDPTASNATTLDGFDPFADLVPAAASNINPPSGFQGGFTVATVSGSGFDGVTSVTFGGTQAIDFDVVNNSTLVVTAPAGPLGQTVNVVVTDGFGSSTLTNAYTFVANPAPNITTVDPATGNVIGGTVVTISGPNVVGVTEARFGGIAGTDLQILDATTLEVTTPTVATIGPADVTVLGNGSDTIPGGFTFFNPGSVTPIHPGFPGTLGIPTFTAFGDLLPGGSGFSLVTTAALGSAFGMMWVSGTQAAIPFYGGTFYPFPILYELPLVVGVFGSINIPVLLPLGFPEGIDLILQQAFVDPGAAFGVSVTNGLHIRLAED